MKQLITALLLLAISSISAQTIEGRIADILVENNYSASAEYILNKSQLSVGTGIHEKDIQNAIKALYRTGIFEQIEILLRQTEAGNVLVIRVDEFPRIERIMIKGNSKKKDKDILENTTVNEGLFASKNNIYKLEREIIDYYRNEGYLNADADIEEEPIDENHSSLIVKVTENSIVHIKHIEIYGNFKVTDDYIKSKMKTKNRGFLREGLFKEEEFEEDKALIIQLIREKGFPDAVLDSVNTRLSYDNKDMFIDIFVTQGKRYYFGNVNIEGNEEIKSSVIARYIKMQKGDIFNQTKLDETISGLYEHYMNRGYIFVSVIPVDNRRDSIIDYTLKITENNPATIRKIMISGNESTEDAVIRREILSIPGDIFRRSDIVISHSNLFRTGYFEDVQINPMPVPEMDMIDVGFDVKEKSTGNFNIGAQYNQVDGLSGNITVGVSNIMGKGVSSNVSFEYGKSIINFNGSFTEPYLMGYPVSTSMNAYWYTKDYTYYNDRRKGGKLTLGYLLSKRYNIRTYVSYKLEEVYLSTSLDTSVLSPYINDQLGDPRWVSEVSPSIVRDSRNHNFFPEAGQLTGIYFNFAGGILGGETDYYKMTLDMRHYQKLFWKFVLMGRFGYGFVDSYNDPGAVPLSERFTLGGVGFWGLRGYYERGIGPYSSDYCIGGRSAAVFNFELRLKLNEQAYLLAFYDVGNAWENFSEAYANKFQPLYQGIGVGVRMEIPMMGILGIDLGYGFTDTDFAGGESWEPHFQIGTSF